MGVFEHFPYTNFHELNLDWIIGKINSLETDWQLWKPTHEIKLANPIDWQETTSYDVNTIVFAPDGNSYCSKTVVPAGISYQNTTYWAKIADYNAQTESYSQIVETYKHAVDTYNSSFETYKAEQSTLNTIVKDITHFYQKKVISLPETVSQGICYDSTRNKFYISSITEDTGKQSITTVDGDTLATEANYNFINLGHANSLVYNPTTDKIYCTKELSSIAIINPANMSVESTFAVNEPVSALAFDRVKNLFIGLGYTPASQKQYIYLYDPNFNLTKTIEIKYLDEVTNGIYANAGIVIVNHISSIECYNIDGDTLSTVQVNSALEFEDMDTKNGSYYFIVNDYRKGALTTFNIWVYDTTTEHNPSLLDSNSIENSVKVDYDLNGFMEPGTYSVSLSNIDKTEICHFPLGITTVYVVVSRLPSSQKLIQTAYNVSTNSFSDIRIRAFYEGVWTAWKTPGNSTTDTITVTKWSGACLILGTTIAFSIPLAKDVSIYNEAPTAVTGTILLLKQNGNTLLSNFSFDTSKLAEKYITPSGINFGVTTEGLSGLTVDGCAGIIVSNLVINFA